MVNGHIELTRCNFRLIDSLSYFTGQKFALLEEKVIISGVLRRYKIAAAERREDVSIVAELVIRAKNGLNVKLTPRK